MAEVKEKICIVVKETGGSSNIFVGDGAISNFHHEILKITGGILPGLEFEPACLPFAGAYAGPIGAMVGKRTVQFKVGDIIKDDALEEFRRMGIKTVMLPKLQKRKDGLVYGNK